VTEGHHDSVFGWSVRLIGKLKAELDFLQEEDIRFDQLGEQLQNLQIAHAQLGHSLTKVFFQSRREAGDVGA